MHATISSIEGPFFAILALQFVGGNETRLDTSSERIRVTMVAEKRDVTRERDWHRVGHDEKILSDIFAWRQI